MEAAGEAGAPERLENDSGFAHSHSDAKSGFLLPTPLTQQRGDPRDSSPAQEGACTREGKIKKPVRTGAVRAGEAPRTLRQIASNDRKPAWPRRQRQRPPLRPRFLAEGSSRRCCSHWMALWTAQSPNGARSHLHGEGFGKHSAGAGESGQPRPYSASRARQQWGLPCSPGRRKKLPNACTLQRSPSARSGSHTPASLTTALPDGSPVLQPPRPCSHLPGPH